MEELARVTQYFATKVGETVQTVQRNEYGVFDEDMETIFAQAPDVYQWVETQYPFLEFEDKAPKPMVFSRFMSQINFTGVYFGYTGESNINVDAPACFIPTTIAHELAHQRSIASEQACNFLAVLASTTSGIPAYEYAGYLDGYLHLSNALYKKDPIRWKEIHNTVPEEALMDLSYNSYYWSHFQGVAAAVSSVSYDAMLKSYGDENGVNSYGMVVDLLLAYYEPQV